MRNPFQQARFLTSAWQAADFVADQGREVAFAGRSNAGKSSALNAIAGQRGLARISKTPGRTQLVNFFELDESHRLVDLPGYGYARVPEQVKRHWRTLMEDYFSTRASLAGLMLVMDVRRPLTEFDEQMLHWAYVRDCPVHVLLTKSDKLSRGAAAASLQKTRRALGNNATVQLFSALKRLGENEARGALAALLGIDPEPAAD